MITGAAGFVGRSLVDVLHEEDLVLLARRNFDSPHKVFVETLDSVTDYSEILLGVEVVIHTAALVHQRDSASEVSDSDFFHTNVDATINLAQQALEMGVKHFVHLSSVKVNGEETMCSSPFSSSDPPDPRGAYALSKAAAESALNELDCSCDMVISIIRPPLVYGPSVEANFSTLVWFAGTYIPFPYSSAAGKRSLVSIWNLCDLIKTLISAQPKESSTYMVSDGSDCTALELISYLRKALKRPHFVIPFPQDLLRFFLYIGNAGSLYQKLFCSLQVDISDTLGKLNWTPKHSTADGVRMMIEALD